MSMVLRSLVLIPLCAMSCARQPMARGAILANPDSTAVSRRPATTSLAFPADDWREAAPESLGLSSARLADAVEFAVRENIPVHEILVARRGVIVLDASFYPFARGERHDIASITKSVTSMLAGVAAARGLLTLDSDATAILGSPQGGVTVEHLLGMRSGYDCGFGRGEVELEAMKRSADWIRFALAMPRRSRPGTEFGYCSPNYHLASALLTKVSGQSELDFARATLFGPIGIRDANWPADDQGLSHGWGDLQLTPRDLARLGLLMLDDGAWNGRRLLPEGWVAKTTAPRVKYGANLYGLGWWSHPDGPKGMFEAIGRGGQRLTIWPDKDLVVVMLGGGYEPGPIGAHLLAALIADTAIAEDPSGRERLQRALASAATLPPETTSASPVAPKISGRVYAIDDNPLGLQQVRLVFDAAGAAATLALRDRRLELPIGLRGRYAIAPTGIDGIRPGTRGRWVNDSTFRLELDLIGKIDHYDMSFTFHGTDSLDLELVERTGLMRQTLRGKALE